MDIIRRNTDYALRAMVHLAHHYGGGAVSTKHISQEQDFSYALACKLMQRLQKAGLVASVMGARGGFFLSRTPEEISLKEVIEAIQGPIRLSRCLLGVNDCCKFDVCPIRGKLGKLQADIGKYLTETTLDELMSARHE